MRKMFWILALFSSVAFAAPMADAPMAECDGIKFATGPTKKGYSNLFRDIKQVCGSKVNLCEVITDGGMTNVTMLSTKEADVGLVQIDTWMDMKNSDDNIAALQAIMYLNTNYLHIITSTKGYFVTKDKKIAGVRIGSDAVAVPINNFTDLQGQRIAVVGSAALMVRRLAQRLNYKMDFVDVKSDADGIAKVQNGEVAAVLTVSSWPSGALRERTQADNITLIPFNAVISEPFKVKPLNYKGIAVYNNNPLGSQNILVTRPFSGQRAAAIATLQSCIQSNLTELKEGNFQPGWNEVKSTTEGGAIPLFKKSK